MMNHLGAAEERARQAELDRVRATEHRKRARVQLALAAAVAILLVGGGAVAWWADRQTAGARERLTRNAAAVEALLAQCEDALRNKDATKAEIALEEAQRRAAEGGAADLQERLAAHS